MNALIVARGAILQAPHEQARHQEKAISIAMRREVLVGGNWR